MSNPEPPRRDSPITVTVEPPLSPESLIDIVQALGGLTSDSPAQRDTAQKIYKTYFEDLPAKYEANEPASAYLREVLAAAASALRGFAVERTAFKHSKAREEKLEEIRARLIEPKFFHSPIDSERWSKLYALLAKLVGPAAGVITLAKVWHELPWWGVLFVALTAGTWIFFGDLLFALLTVRLQLFAYRRAGNTQRDVRTVWSSSVPTYKELSFQLLITADRARERWFPASRGLLEPLRWADVRIADVRSFLDVLNERLEGRAPAEALSRIVDLHFGVGVERPLYRNPQAAVDRTTVPIGGANPPAQVVSRKAASVPSPARRAGKATAVDISEK